MRRLALVLPFLIACASKPAPTTPAPEPAPAAEPTEDGAPPVAPAPDEPVSGEIDYACYDECMAYVDDEASCEVECGGGGGDDGYDAAGCFEDCMMAMGDEDFCNDDCPAE